MLNKIIAALAYRTTKRYNVVKLRDLSVGYWDKDELMLHAVMQLVVDFVEVECSFMELDVPMTFRETLWCRLPWFLRSDDLIRSRERGLKHLKSLISMYEDGMKDSSGHPRIIRDAYLYWRDTRPQKMKAITDLYESLKHTDCRDDTKLDVIHKLEQDIEKQDTKVLKKIMQARTFMWT